MPWFSQTTNQNALFITRLILLKATSSASHDLDKHLFESNTTALV